MRMWRGGDGANIESVLDSPIRPRRGQHARKANRELGAATGAGARSDDLAAVQPDQSAYHAEPEAHAALRPVEGLRRLREGFEDRGENLGADADARIDDAQDGGVAVRDRHLDATAGRRVLEGVGEEVVDDLFQSKPVTHDDDREVRRVEAQSQAALAAAATRLVDEIPHQCREIDRRQLERDLARRDPGDVEEVVDQQRQRINLPIDDGEPVRDSRNAGRIALQQLGRVSQRTQGIAQFVTEQGQELIALPDVSLPLFQCGARRILTGARPERRARGAHHRQRMDRPLERGHVAELGERLQRPSVLERRRRPRHEDDERKVRPGRLVAKGSGERRDDREAERLLGHERAARALPDRRHQLVGAAADRGAHPPLLEQLGRQHGVATRGREDQQLVLPKGGISHCRHGTHPPEECPRSLRTWERR